MNGQNCSCWLWYFSCINSSGFIFKYYLTCIILLPHHLRQLPLSTHPARIHTDDVSTISVSIMCLFHWVGHHYHFCRLSCVRCTRGKCFFCWLFSSGRWGQMHCSETTFAVILGVRQYRKFLMPTSSPLFPASLYIWYFPSWFLWPIPYRPLLLFVPPMLIEVPTPWGINDAKVDVFPSLY